MADIQYVASADIEVYPSGFRGEGYPKSKLSTEENLCSLRLISKNKENNRWVMRDPNASSYIIIALDGYYFRLQETNIPTFSSSSTYATIKLRTINNIGECLANYTNTSTTILDNENKFQGLAFVDQIPQIPSGDPIYVQVRNNNGSLILQDMQLSADEISQETGGSRKPISTAFSTGALTANTIEAKATGGSGGSITGSTITARNTLKSDNALEGKTLTLTNSNANTTVINAPTGKTTLDQTEATSLRLYKKTGNSTLLTLTEEVVDGTAMGFAKLDMRGIGTPQLAIEGANPNSTIYIAPSQVSGSAPYIDIQSLDSTIAVKNHVTNEGFATTSTTSNVKYATLSPNEFSIRTNKSTNNILFKVDANENSSNNVMVNRGDFIVSEGLETSGPVPIFQIKQASGDNPATAEVTKGNLNVAAGNIDCKSTATDQGKISCTSLETTTINVETNGQINCAGQISASSFLATSDIRKKENVEEYHCEKSILDLPIKKYDFIDGKKNQIGCIAQDLQQICPELVEENSDGYLSIQETKLVYLLLQEVKDLKAELAELKQKIK